MKAFWNLSTTRQNGFGIGAIPYDKITDYADRKGLEPDVADLFVEIITAMDIAFLDWQQENKPKTENPK